MKIERRPLLAVRAAVDVHDQRALRRLGVSPSGFVRNASTSNLLSFDDERQRLDLGQPLAAEDGRVEIGHLPAGDRKLRRDRTGVVSA